MMNSLTKYIGILGLWMLGLAANAQYSLMPVQPPPYFTFNDLWHLTLIRSQADGYSRFYLTLRVFNESGQLRIKSNSAQFSLETGSHYYHSGNLGELQPFTTSYHDAGLLQQAVASGGVFPAGTYNMVYVLHGKAGDGEFVSLAEANTQVTVEAMWPPMLLSPTDGEVINTTYPLLTWTPAFSSAYSGPVSYTLRLVEVLSGQNAFQAIQANPVYFSQSNLLTTTLPYPPAAQALDTGQVYAWQVHADAGGGSLGSSEVWTFSLSNEKTPKKAAEKQPYFLLSANPKSEYVIINNGTLYLSHIEKLNDVDDKLAFDILDQHRKKVADQNKLDKVSTEGYNKIKISLCSNSTGFNLPKGHYTIIIKGQSGTKYSLNFFHDKTREGCVE